MRSALVTVSSRSVLIIIILKIFFEAFIHMYYPRFSACVSFSKTEDGHMRVR